MDGIIKKVMKIKGIGYIALAIVAAVIILCLPAEKSSDRSAEYVPSDVFSDYSAELTKRTESIISSMSGVYGCKVMITFESGFSYSYAADQTLQRTFDGSGKTVLENASKEYITVSSGGAASPVEIKRSVPKISGIAVVCPNASDSTRLLVTETVKALFDLSSNRISVQN